MSKKRKIFIFFSFFISVLLMNAGFVYALEASYPPILGMTITNDSSFPEYAKYFFNIGMILAGALAVVVIAFGAVYYLIDFARGKFIDEGKDWIKAGVFGLVLTVSAYLITYTINPYLVIFDLKGLAPLTFISNYFNPPPPSPPIEIYSEIPIGTLTEKLLSRTTDCYDFDGNGDPIEGDRIKADDGRTVYGPTYLEHDRADCVLKLGQAAEKKALIFKKLSDEIVNLMNQCSCQGVCGSNCNDNNDGCQVSGDKCTGKCVNGKCSQPPGTTDCCPAGVKDKAEHGPINIAGYDGLEREYKGLDEFRSQYNNNYLAIKNIAEIRPAPKLNGKEITVINTGNCAPCNYQCPVCDPTKPDYRTCLRNQQTCQQNQQTCQQNRRNCLKNTPWYKLRMVDQLTYLQGKIGEIKQKVQQDLDQLKSAESQLGRCYLPDTYEDFLKTYEQTDKENKTILVERTFSDADTRQLINPAKYCQGFQYNNSSCYSQCQKECPQSADDIKCISKAPSCNLQDKNYETCLKDQNNYLKDCQEKQKCTFSDGSYSNFQGCMSSCQSQCLNLCDLKSGNDKNKCIQDCNNDSQCLLNNENKCLVNVESIQSCVKNSNDDASLENCAQSAKLCSYCSDQYAGYPECLKNPYSLQGKYSASFIYQHPDYQICTFPYKVITIDNPDGTTSATTCLNLYPETAKCPSTSKCPQCPCDILDKTINYSPLPTNPNSSCTSSSSSSSSSGGGCACPGGIPGTPSCYPPCSSSSSSGSSGGSSSNSSGGGSATRITEYRVCSGTCDSYAYNDDPLTFYCQQSWWLFKDEVKNTTPIGNDRICPKEKEIPVGKTVDDAEKWAQDFMSNIDKITKKIEDMLQYIKRITQKTNYCRCDSQCENGKPVCHTDCNYNPPTDTKATDSNTGTETTVTTPPSCSYVPCSGKGCQVMIDLLSGATCQKACAMGEGMAYYYNQINKAVKDFEATAQQSKSDILKELNYSRQQTNSCSVTQNNYGTQTRILNCTRVENEIISPTVDKYSKTIIGNKSFTSYCYGKSLGEILKTPEPMADNWFCCEERQKEKQ